jgi:hypothetical protein
MQGGRQRNTNPIQLFFRNFLVTEMMMYCVAIAQVVCHRKEGDCEDRNVGRA